MANPLAARDLHAKRASAFSWRLFGAEHRRLSPLFDTDLVFNRNVARDIGLALET
jgi:hypothetical protein